ncbi:MAG: UvrD-helicase domain-containing protein [Phycisphaeraceae bacterium]|nr:UvrD-helicase domain-containing protein [Phycisphaeraceae bacterium]
MTENGGLLAGTITDDDVRRAARLLGLPYDCFHGPDGLDPRHGVLKCMETIDVAACPGSGKTTLLVAKLAILAEKWPHRTRGICVLSHTNAARREIENRLGQTATGRSLLAYPHFVGTIHAFVNEFLAVPSLRSRGYPITLIDSEVCEARRWSRLSQNTRYALRQRSIEGSDIRIANTHFEPAKKHGTFSFGPHTNTHKCIQRACMQVAREGFHCHDDMFIWGNALMDEHPGVANVLRSRFPLLFIDECQDNSEDQATILRRVFGADPMPVIRQRFGDSNQAIFGFIKQEGATTDLFPSDAKVDLPNSHRFGQRIADLADPLAVDPCGLIGRGPRLRLASGSTEATHTIFLFNDDGVRRVLDAYGELLLATFSDLELREGSFVAVGHVHKREQDDHCPRHVGHYWPEYDPELSKSEPKPSRFVQYITSGQSSAQAVGETYVAIERIAQGCLRLGGMGSGTRTAGVRKHSHRYVRELLSASERSRALYTVMVSRYGVKRRELTKRAWDQRLRAAVQEIGETIAGCPLASREAQDFLAWPASAPGEEPLQTGQSRRDNVYRYSIGGREVAIRIGSIHSVKGETHTATLVFETFWNRHNLEDLRDWLLGDRSGAGNDGVQRPRRLKAHYVAMTRPTHLLCLAMKRSTFAGDDGALDADAVSKLQARGWRVIEMV